ncbi:MAG: family 10 glycosylhydrolase [Muribaculaceae bacterium]|nr:family 10 glycosylhydrolase [Muribaculaceae bacterium]
MKHLKSIVVAAAMLLATSVSSAQDAPKREFRGAWMHIIGQGQYARMTPGETQDYLRDQLSKLDRAGVNAVIWQIRPQADAAYSSNLEPWSRWLTGEAGKAPTPLWDPLQFMIDECHNRGMELHAWINPYRVTSGDKDKPAPGHIYYKHPEWFLRYADGKIYFDPALPESRDFINRVVRDIITRYDVDAIHMDDYFYPYPVKGVEFPDTASYARYGAGWGDKGDWRRHNVDMLIEQLHATIHSVKPWVRLGISPFGIWRNKRSDSNGSETNGLECYDALYADCPKWTALGWVDYMTPQLYWELEHKAASDLVLSYWWNDHANGRHMYYGQAVRNVMDHRDIPDTLNPTQLNHKIELMRSLPNVHGVTWWPAYSVTENYKGVLDSLSNNQMRTRALCPAVTWLDDVAPEAVQNLRVERERGENILKWDAVTSTDPMHQAVRYVVYQFPERAAINLDDASAIKCVTNATTFTLPKQAPQRKKVKPQGHTYVVTALDRCNNESAPGKAVSVPF